MYFIVYRYIFKNNITYFFNNNMNNHTNINNNKRIPFELMNKDKLYKNIVESNNINYYINEK